MEHTAYNYASLKKHCGERCLNCGSRQEIEYHHIVPLSLGGNDVLSNIAPICSRCHSLIHFGANNEISHSEATKRGIEKAKRAGKQIGRKAGVKIETKKSLKAKELILILSNSFRGYMTDAEVINIIGGISRNTYYKYKKELKEEAIKYTKHI